VSYGPVLNAAAVILTAYGNVPPERAAQIMGMLLDVPVSPGWVDKASTRLAAQLGKAGFEAVMLGAGRPGRAGRRRDPGERAGQDTPARRPSGSWRA
jgi:hypothetical protein